MNEEIIKFEKNGYECITPCQYKPRLEPGIVALNTMAGSGICSKYCLNHSFTDEVTQTVICNPKRSESCLSN